jgi:hypothetical protein
VWVAPEALMAEGLLVSRAMVEDHSPGRMAAALQQALRRLGV